VYVRVIKYIHQQRCILRFSVQMISKGFPQCVRSYAIQAELFSCTAQNVICLLPGNRLIRQIRIFEKEFKILFIFNVIINNCLQFFIYGKAFFFLCFALALGYEALPSDIPYSELQDIRYPQTAVYSKHEHNIVSFIFSLEIIRYIQYHSHITDWLDRIHHHHPPDISKFQDAKKDTAVAVSQLL